MRRPRREGPGRSATRPADAPTAAAETETPAFTYAEREPPAALRDVVWACWSFTMHAGAGSERVHVVFPDGCFGLVGVRERDGHLRLVLMGPRVEPHEVPARAGSFYFGVRFHPWAGAAMLGVDAAEWRGRLMPLDFVRPDWIPQLRAAALDVPHGTDDAIDWSKLDAWLSERASAVSAPDDVVRRAVGLIVARNGAEPVTAIAGALGVGVRQLQRRFRAATGLTPKELSRVRRWRTAMAGALDDAREVGWSRIAAAAGYADHAHLTRESAELSGEPPTRLAERLRSIAHRNVRP